VYLRKQMRESTNLIGYEPDEIEVTPEMKRPALGELHEVGLSDPAYLATSIFRATEVRSARRE
jgi:hypothetical protein